MFAGFGKEHMHNPRLTDGNFPSGAAPTRGATQCSKQHTHWRQQRRQATSQHQSNRSSRNGQSHQRRRVSTIRTTIPSLHLAATAFAVALSPSSLSPPSAVCLHLCPSVSSSNHHRRAPFALASTPRPERHPVVCLRPAQFIRRSIFFFSRC